MAQFNLSTTGLTITLTDLGITLNHPSTVNLYDDGGDNRFSPSEITDSLELQEALTNGTLTASNENGDPILQVTPDIYLPKIGESATGYSVFPVWAEESGTLGAGATEWSFGNGDETPLSSGIPIGVDCELFAIGAEVENGTGVIIEAIKNGVAVAETITFSTKNITVLGSPISFLVEDLINFRTKAVTASTSGRPVAWFRVPLLGLKGDPGLDGDDGLPGADGDITWTGPWSAGTYLANQATEFGGSSYVATTTTTQQPPNSDWELFASKGDPGASGGASYCKVENTDITTNLNLVATGFSTIVPLNGTTILTGTDFTPTGNGIQCNFTGVVNVKANIHYFSAGQRVSLLGRTRVAGTPTGMVAATGYVRNTSGHSEASLHIDDFFNVTNGDVIDIGVHRETTTTTSTNLALAGSSNLILNKIE